MSSSSSSSSSSNPSTSLTPLSRSNEAASEATQEGLMNGLCTLIPTCGAIYIALKQSPAFVLRTNWQSRTAMAIMPALFVFAYTSEHKLSHKMKQIAQETRHNNETVHWAEQQLQSQSSSTDNDEQQEHFHLTELYQKSIAQSGVCIVPGNQLQLHHKIANFAADNPIKVLAAVAVPSVAAIFYGKTGKQHLDFSVKLLHTRVFGQFATISLLLSVMGFKEYMDQNGKFVTEAEAEHRVAEMHRVRLAMMKRLNDERQIQVAFEQEIEQAQKADLEKERKNNNKKKQQ